MKRIVFFGGCTGVGKSKILYRALQKTDENSYDIIRISQYFNKEHLESTTMEHGPSIEWDKDDWKRYELSVINNIIEHIKEQSEDKLFIINQHFATTSPFGFLPGVDLDSLDCLLKAFYASDNFPSKKSNDIEYCFGVLLIDTKLSAILDYHRSAFLETLGRQEGREENDPRKNMLSYLSEEKLEKDLEENRKWANLYSTRIGSTLGQRYVLSDTIYIHDKELTEPIAKTKEFFKKLGLKCN